MLEGWTLGMESRGVNANPHLKIRAGRVLIPGFGAKLLTLVTHLYPHSFYVGYHLFLTQAFAYRKLVENHSVEGEVLVVDRVQGAPHHPCLDFVLLVRQELQLYIRVAEGREDRGSP